MAATWIGQYQQPSFRGIEFFIRAASGPTGRRIVSHNFPDKEDVFHQDMGRAERPYTFDAYIVGDDYFQHREDLIKACEQRGVGKLVHPYRGVRNVVCRVCEPRETTEEGRVARFNLEFVEQVSDDLTVTTTNSQAEVAAAVAAAKESFEEVMAEEYTLASKPVGFLQDAEDTLNAVFDDIDKVKKTTAAIPEFKQALQSTVGKIDEFILSGRIIAQNIWTLTEFGTVLTDAFFSPTVVEAFNQYTELRDLFSRKDAVNTGTSPVLFDEPDYPAQLVQLTQAYSAGINSVSLATVIPFENVDQANEIRDEIFSTLDEITANPISSDALISNLRDLKKSINTNLDERILDLSGIFNFTLPVNQTTLNVTHEFYGNNVDEESFIGLNKILHPGMVPAQVGLKAVIDV